MPLTEVTPASVAYICLAGIFVVCTILSRLIKEKLFVNEFVIGTIGGILMGPFVTNIFNPRRWTTHSNQFTLECMRIVLVLRLFAIGVELPGSYLHKHARSLLLVVIPTMVIGWPMIAAILYIVFPELDFVSCLVISSCLIPTDPVGCANFVSGSFAKEHLTLDVRQLLVAQSATGDALAYPFLSLALYLTVDNTPGIAFYHWITIGCLYQVVLAVTIGAILGFFFSFVMKQCYKYGVIDRESYAGQFLGLAIFIAGVARAVGCNDLIASFAAGTALSWDGVFNEQLDGEQVFTSVITNVVNSTCSMYIGAWLPFSDFAGPELGVTPPKLVVLAFTILFLRRIPAFLTVYKLIPEISSWREALLCGYFGPLGVRSVFILTLATYRLSQSEIDSSQQQQELIRVMEPVVAVCVLSSMVIHGASPPFLQLMMAFSSVLPENVLTTQASLQKIDWKLRLRLSCLTDPPNANFPDLEKCEKESDLSDNPQNYLPDIVC